MKNETIIYHTILQNHYRPINYSISPSMINKNATIVTYNLSNLAGGTNVVHGQIHLQRAEHALHTVLFTMKKI